MCTCPAHRPRRAGGSRPTRSSPMVPSDQRTSSATAVIRISRLNHTARTHACLVLHTPQLPTERARFASGCSVSLAGRDWLPVGLHHKVSSRHEFLLVQAWPVALFVLFVCALFFFLLFYRPATGSSAFAQPRTAACSSLRLCILASLREIRSMRPQRSRTYSGSNAILARRVFGDGRCEGLRFSFGLEIVTHSKFFFKPWNTPPARRVTYLLASLTDAPIFEEEINPMAPQRTATRHARFAREANGEVICVYREPMRVSSRKRRAQ